MTTIKAKLRLSSVEGRPGSIVYAVTHHRITRQITTDYKLFPHEWNCDTCTVIENRTGARKPLLSIISERIKWDLARLKAISQKMESSGREYTSQSVIDEFNIQSSQQSFFRHMQTIISRLRQLNRTGTANNYQFTLNSFSRFRHDQDIRLEEITVHTIEEYEAWLKSEGVSLNSSSFYMRNLRAAYNRAVESELISDCRPFRKAYTGIMKTAKRAITIKEIKRIKDLDLALMPKLDFARDIFMFQFYAMGISFVDVAYLTHANIKGSVLAYRRHKTSQEITIPINSHIQAIISKYSNKESKYIFPIIVDSEKSEREQYESMIHKINPRLKKIGLLAGLSIPLTTYVARHSWASIAKHKGIDIGTISDALGHENIKTTEIYLSSIGTDLLERANAKILKDL